MGNELESIAGAFDALLRREQTIARREEADLGWSPALWRAVTASGFDAVAVDEARGGAGAGQSALGPVAERAGYHAAPIPVLRANVGALACALLGVDAPDWLVLAADLRHHANLPASAASLPVIAHPLRRLPWATPCDELFMLLPADAGEAGIARIPGAACEVQPGTDVAGEPCADWTPLAPIEMYAAPRATVRRLCDLLAVARGSAIVGAARRVLDLSFAHVRDRRQFGRPIVAFQAVQHELAELANVIEQLQAMLDEAYERADGSDDGHLWSLAVETCAGLAAARAVRTGHQLHGAIGITTVYALQRYTRRLMAWRDEGGSEVRAALELGRSLRGSSPARVWQVSTAHRTALA
ncbi:MAG: acyl-CoA dehydrogenase family protein [Rubrivivax sp.]